MRIGMGYDVHKLVENRDLIIGGVKIPYEKGLLGHSDADVMLHAVSDALLGAAGLRDIGFYFPDSNEKWKNADSMKMLSNVVEMLAERKFALKNISIAIQAEKPRLAKYIDDMKNSLSSVLKLDQTAIGISAGTNEGLGYIGEGKGITVNAYALLKNI